MATSAELTEKVLAVAHLIRRISMKSLAPLGLTPAQSRTLRLVAAAEEPVRMGEIAARMGIVPRSATSLVAALEESELVERTIDPSNRRAILVTLTDRGRAAFREISAARVAAGGELFGTLTEAEREQLSALLTKVRGEVGQLPTGR